MVGEGARTWLGVLSSELPRDPQASAANRQAGRGGRSALAGFGAQSPAVHSPSPTRCLGKDTVQRALAVFHAQQTSVKSFPHWGMGHILPAPRPTNYTESPDRLQTPSSRCQRWDQSISISSGTSGKSLPVSGPQCDIYKMERGCPSQGQSLHQPSADTAPPYQQETGGQGVRTSPTLTSQ